MTGPTVLQIGPDMSANSLHALEMHQITKDFGGVKALTDVTIQVKRGEIYCLVGENGAGKSTLMKILAGVFPANTYAGEILLEGKKVTFFSPHDAKVKGIGFVPQEIGVVEQLSVAENIFVGHLNPSRGPVVHFSRLYSRARTLLNSGGMDLDPRWTVSALNSSQRQLVMIARALSNNPLILILDEPTSALTHGETENLFRIVRHLQRQGGTIILSTHKLEEVMEMSDRVTVLRDGRVVSGFERGKFSQADIIAAMVGRKMENLFPSRASEIGRETVLRVEGLTVPHPRIRNRNLVEDINFSVHRGEILGLAGLVGSGRSVILNSLCGRFPNTGRVLVDGRPTRIETPQQAKLAGVGLITEDRKKDGLLFNFTIRENITLSNLQAISRWRLIRPRQERAVVDDLMKKLTIRAKSPATMVGNLSGGNQQKVLFAKALMAGPKVLLLDDPTKGVDVGTKYEIYKLMFQLATQGVSLVLTSSELPELLAMCDRFLVLQNGKIKDRLTKAEASADRIMQAATGASYCG
jgi:ribose transport system ATP-binding protein